MPLFQVQDADRPLYVIAEDFTMALNAWTACIAVENKMEEKDVEPPLGINYLCPNNDLILCQKQIT